MEWEIKSEENETFTINSKQMGEVAVASDVVIEEESDKEVEEMQLLRKTKRAAPLENPKGLGWFDGTSWGTK